MQPVIGIYLWWHSQKSSRMKIVMHKAEFKLQYRIIKHLYQNLRNCTTSKCKIRGPNHNASPWFTELWSVYKISSVTQDYKAFVAL